MFGVTTSDDYRPVAWMGRYPVDVTAILVIAHVAAMVLGCFLIAFGASGVLTWMAFDSAAVLHRFALHQLVTYAFVHPPSGLLWFAIEMYMLFVFGREVERFLGRKAFIALYAILVLGPALLLAGWGLEQRTGLSGSAHVHLGVFVAFATIYPRAELLFRILAKWAAIVLVAAYSLQLLAYHVWWELAALWFVVAAAFFFVEWRGAGPELTWLNDVKTRLRPRPKFRVLPKPSTRRAEPDDMSVSVDAILEKISKSGMSSLTESERRQLERARTQLLKKSE